MSAVALLAGMALTTQAQVVIFSENFDPLSPAGSVQYGYQFGDATSHSVGVVAGVGVGGTAGLQIQMSAATPTNGYAGVAGQYQNQTLSANTSLNPGDYTLSFDATGSGGGSLKVQVQTWDGQHFSGSSDGTLSTPSDLTLSSSFQHYSINLGTLSGSLTGLGVAGKTYQLNLQLDGGGQLPYTDTVVLDNLQLTMIPEPSVLALVGLSGFGLLFRRRS